MIYFNGNIGYWIAALVIGVSMFTTIIGQIHFTTGWEYLLVLKYGVLTFIATIVGCLLSYGVWVYKMKMKYIIGFFSVVIVVALTYYSIQNPEIFLSPNQAFKNNTDGFEKANFYKIKISSDPTTIDIINVIATIIGAFGGLLLLWQAYNTYVLEKRRIDEDTFTKALEKLSPEKGIISSMIGIEKIDELARNKPHKNFEKSMRAFDMASQLQTDNFEMIIEDARVGGDQTAADVKDIFSQRTKLKSAQAREQKTIDGTFSIAKKNKASQRIEEIHDELNVLQTKLSNLLSIPRWYCQLDRQTQFPINLNFKIINAICNVVTIIKKTYPRYRFSKNYKFTGVKIVFKENGINFWEIRDKNIFNLHFNRCDFREVVFINCAFNNSKFENCTLNIGEGCSYEDETFINCSKNENYPENNMHDDERFTDQNWFTEKTKSSYFKDFENDDKINIILKNN